MVRNSNPNYQRKLGSNTSVLRTNRLVRLDIDEGWSAVWHHITKELTLTKGGVRLDITSSIHHKKNLHWWRVVWDLTSRNNTSHKRIYIDEGWCETWHHITIHHKRIDIDEGWCATWHHITIHHKRIDIDEGWCGTWHHITIHHKRIDIDEGWRETWHHITIHHTKELTLMKGDVRLDIK